MCPVLKKLSNKQQPFTEVVQVINEIKASKKGTDERILEHLLSYSEFQFGKEVIGIGYRERGNGERISNWYVEIGIWHDIYSRLTNFHAQNGFVNSDDAMYPYLKRSLSLLNPYSINLDSDVGNRLTENQEVYLLSALISTEGNMAKVVMNRGQFDVAEGHCQRCLAHSKRSMLDGELKTNFMFDALSVYCSLRERQGNYPGAVSFAEECYNIVVEAYDPVHPKVQKAAGILIDILIRKGDLYDAERYAQVTYGNLRDKTNGIDQEGEEMAMGVQNLADVIFRQRGDLMKAERLAREALHIRSQLHNVDEGNSCDLLGRILQAQGNLGDETKELFERALAIAVRCFGSEGLDAATGYFNFGQYYCQHARTQTSSHLERTDFLLAKSHFEKANRIISSVFGPTDPRVFETKSKIADIVSELSSI
jgi:tetratricopeptide (TPR) repeat protein